MKTGSKPETDIPTSGDSGSSSLPLCTEPISLLSPLHSSPAGGAKTHALVCQTPLRGRSSVSPSSLLLSRDATNCLLKCSLLFLNRKIQH